MYAWMDAEDKFNVLPTTANRLGDGESPSETCGFNTNVDRFQRFGCIGTLNVQNKNLVANQDGSVSVAKGSRQDAESSAVVVPEGTNKSIPLAMIRKVIDIHPSTLERVKTGLPPQSYAGSQEIVFERFEVDPVMVDKNRTEAGEHEVATPNEEDDCGPESDESMMEAIELHEQSTAPVTNVGDSLCGQRMMEQHAHGTQQEAATGWLAGKRVQRMPKAEAAKVVGRALKDKKVKFIWDHAHEKAGNSGLRYKIYSKRVHNVADYEKVRRERIPGVNKCTITKGDLVHDVSLGALTFQQCLSVTPIKRRPDIGRYIHGTSTGVVHEVLAVKTEN
jgi:hypothetical protein